MSLSILTLWWLRPDKPLLRRWIPWIVLMAAQVAFALLGMQAHPVRADGVVGDGTPASCTEAALDAALAAGGTIEFNCGPAPHTILFTGMKSINLDTTLDGGGLITLDGQGAHRLFDVGARLTLRNLVLTRGYFNGDGGAIRNTSAGRLVLEDSTIRDSQAEASGGAILSTGPMTITRSLLENNRALNGGALYPRFSAARTTIVDSVLRDNHATDTTNGWGGAILTWDGAPVTIAASELYSNTARDGGAIFNFSNTVLTLESGTTLRNNNATISGGGLSNYGTATLTNVIISINSAGYGGGLLNYGTSTLSNTTLSANAATLAGGMYNTGTATLTDVTLSDNSAIENGGGLYNDVEGTAALSGVTISGNSAVYLRGGGLLNSGTGTLTNVTLSGNTAHLSGGGLYNDGQATLIHTTFSGNSAGSGGGLFSVGTKPVSLISVASYTGRPGNRGALQNISTLSVQGSIVAYSLSGGDCAGAIIDAGSNLSSDASCGFGQPAEVLLGPLADNGGVTYTHLPLPGSPAIDHVSAGCPPPAADQRGAARPVDGDGDGSALCDAGAVETGGAVNLVYVPFIHR